MKQEIIDFAVILAYKAPRVFADICNRAEEFEKSVEEYIADSKVNYVIVNEDKTLNRNEQARLDALRYADAAECAEDCQENEIVITEYEYIELLMEYEDYLN